MADADQPHVVYEDDDPASVPQGCHRCYKRDGGDVCLTCPSAQLAEIDRRQMIEQGLISPMQ
jgi:hypothetical protein